jgi:hypothetical protein
MTIITKPDLILKGESFDFTLSKSELANLQILSNDSYFSDTNNWNKVIINYRSTFGNQKKVLTFDASDISPSFVFSTSERVRDSFEVYSIDIVDFDYQIFTISRSNLNVEEFDLNLSGNVIESILLLDDDDTFMLDNDELISL